MVPEAKRTHAPKPGTKVPGIAAEMRLWPPFRGPLVGPLVDFRRVASSRLLKPPFAYKYCRIWPKSEQIENRLVFYLLV